MSNLYDISTYLRYAASADAEEKRRVAEEERQIAAHNLDEARMTPGTTEYEVYRGGGDMGSYPIAELASMIVGGGAARPATAALKEGVRAYRQNFPNLLEFISQSRFLQPGTAKERLENVLSYTPKTDPVRVSFYAGDPLAAGAAMAEGLFRGSKDFLKQLYSPQYSHIWRTKGISKKNVDAARRWMDESETIISDPANWVRVKHGQTVRGRFAPDTLELSSAAKKLLKKEGKIVAGDLNTMAKMFEREGMEMTPLVRAWNNIHFDEARHIHSADLAKELSRLPVAEGVPLSSNLDEVADIMNTAWGLNNKKYITTRMIERRSAGSATSPSDALMTIEYVAANKAHEAGMRTAAQYEKFIQENFPGLKYVAIRDGKDGAVLLSYSPRRKSDLYKGGFNSVAEMKPNGTTTFHLSDEFDLGAGAMKHAMEVGMSSRLLVVHKPKTIRNPFIGEEKVAKALKESEVIPSARPPRVGSSVNRGGSTPREIPKVMQSPMLTGELDVIKELARDANVPVDYLIKFYAKRYGLPAAGVGYASGLLGNRE